LSVVLAQAKENFERKHQLQVEGMSFEHVIKRVSELLDVSPNPDKPEIRNPKHA
jgi:broad-specificity NMP kinase